MASYTSRVVVFCVLCLRGILCACVCAYVHVLVFFVCIGAVISDPLQASRYLWYVCLCVCSGMYVCVYVHVCMYACMYVYTYVYTCICTFMYVCTYVCICMYIHVRMHVCIHICMHIHIHNILLMDQTTLLAFIV